MLLCQRCEKAIRRDEPCCPDCRAHLRRSMDALYRAVDRLRTDLLRTIGPRPVSFEEGEGAAQLDDSLAGNPHVIQVSAVEIDAAVNSMGAALDSLAALIGPCDSGLPAAKHTIVVGIEIGHLSVEEGGAALRLPLGAARELMEMLRLDLEAEDWFRRTHGGHPTA